MEAKENKNGHVAELAVALVVIIGSLFLLTGKEFNREVSYPLAYHYNQCEAEKSNPEAVTKNEDVKAEESANMKKITGTVLQLSGALVVFLIGMEVERSRNRKKDVNVKE